MKGRSLEWSIPVMTGPRMKSENLDTDMHTGKTIWRETGRWSASKGKAWNRDPFLLRILKDVDIVIKPSGLLRKYGIKQQAAKSKH